MGGWKDKLVSGQMETGQIDWWMERWVDAKGQMGEQILDEQMARSYVWMDS